MSASIARNASIARAPFDLRDREGAVQLHDRRRRELEQKQQIAVLLASELQALIEASSELPDSMS